MLIFYILNSLDILFIFNIHELTVHYNKAKIIFYLKLKFKKILIYKILIEIGYTIDRNRIYYIEFKFKIICLN